MAGKHSGETKLLGFWASGELVERVDLARDGKSRGQFLREAAVDYAIKNGIDVPDRLRYATDRAGKGGRPRKQQLKRERGTKRTEEKIGMVSSKIDAALEKSGSSSSVEKGVPKPSLSRKVGEPISDKSSPMTGTQRH